MKTKNKILLKSHPMTLIEVLIATTLTMILLVTVTFFYRQMTIIGRESEKLQKEQFQLAYLEKRLMAVIPKIISPRDRSKNFYFYTSDTLINGSESLVFTYDNLIKLDKDSSGHCLGRLFIDSKQNLVLGSWSAPNRWESNANLQMKKEILMENVQSLKFEFFVPPKKDRSEMATKANLNDIVPENSWHQTWSSSFNQLPAMMKILVRIKHKDENEESIVFAFSLPKSDMVIFYDN